MIRDTHSFLKKRNRTVGIFGHDQLWTCLIDILNTLILNPVELFLFKAQR